MYTIVNATQHTTLATQCALANSFFSRFMGLMGRNQLDTGHGLLLYPVSSIHTFFMRFPIDVVFVNRDHVVVGVREAMNPNLPYAGAKGARYVIELPPGVIATTTTRIGDMIGVNPLPTCLASRRA